ncbi:MAG: serine/threonine protein kinase [Myxococcota bacterium]|jgi:serine/threonine protein kinase
MMRKSVIDYQPMSLQLPTVLGGRYECRKRIGAGGMGEVYLARHLGLDRDVAVKLLTMATSDRQQVERIKERFRREAVALSRLRHPNTVQVIDFGWTDDQRPYIVTELLTGKTLDQVLQPIGVMPAERAIWITMQLCRSLAEAHTYGIVHRDLKPSNIFLIEAFGTEDYVKLIDFGVARIDQTDESARARPLTVEGTTLGTPDYMAPEQARGRTPSPATDVYALGCMLYEMLIGEPPFLGDSALQVMIKHIKEAPLTLSEAAPDLRLPAGLEHAVMLCMRKEMNERPADAKLLLDLLKDILKGPQAPQLEELDSFDSLGDWDADDGPSFAHARVAGSNPGRMFFANAAEETRPPEAEVSGLHRIQQAMPEPDDNGFRRPLQLKRTRSKSERPGSRNAERARDAAGEFDSDYSMDRLSPVTPPEVPTVSVERLPDPEPGFAEPEPPVHAPPPPVPSAEPEPEPKPKKRVPAALFAATEPLMGPPSDWADEDEVELPTAQPVIDTEETPLPEFPETVREGEPLAQENAGATQPVPQFQESADSPIPQPARSQSPDRASTIPVTFEEPVAPQEMRTVMDMATIVAPPRAPASPKPITPARRTIPETYPAPERVDYEDTDEFDLGDIRSQAPMYAKMAVVVALGIWILVRFVF